MKKEKVNIILFLVTIFLLLISSSSSAQSLEDLRSVESFFDGFLKSQIEEYKVPGVTISVVQDGEILFKKGYGYSDLENTQRVDADNTLFRPGSVSKLFIWTSIMQLVEQGKVDLNENVNEYLDFEIPNEIVNKDNTEDIKAITVMNLLNHNAGFEDKIKDLFVLTEADIKPLGTYLREYMPARVYPAGREMAYSNYGSALAAYIVEKVSGMRFDEYVEANIFKPLNMNNSTFRQPVPAEIAGESSLGFAYLNGAYHSDPFEYIQPYPVGALSSTAEDMAKFMLAHLNMGSYQGNRILSPETAADMHSQSFTHHSEFAGMAHGFIEMNYNGYRMITHGGDTFLFHSGLYLIPELNTGLFISYNGRDAAVARDLLIKSFMDRYFPDKNTNTVLSENSNFIKPELIEGKYIINRVNHTTYESITKYFSITNIEVDSSRNIIYNFMGETNRLRQIEPGVFFDNESGNKLYAALNQEGEVDELWTNSPNVLKRASWYEDPLINAAFVLIFIILTLVLSVKWIKSLFKRSVRNKYFLEKITAVVFGFLSIGFIVAIALVFSDLHPIYNVPYLFLETSDLFDKLMIFIWVLPLLLVLLLYTNLRVWAIRNWKFSSKIFYTIYTIFSAGIVWWFYNLNLLVF
ncbi:CubicO group peptidase (beta-lactamase class C family) [Halanaerobium saccharolyticum]|uniref:CubicO group peptidase (Beta-lactamase class C family) n=1 Tax=Halanaerobium saccharolyticum TaxID=43595 RepID=A0A4R6RRT0_9FIRM|nr:serine hydrolase domain-containing protein [Halanaerobium saccharolyticum]TDP88927.1 CubicO group peptidase (beta-lactamase class C family) [Halanaerobium saccharolyticum]